MKTAEMRWRWLGKFTERDIRQNFISIAGGFACEAMIIKVPTGASSYRLELPGKFDWRAIDEGMDPRLAENRVFDVELRNYYPHKTPHVLRAAYFAESNVILVDERCVLEEALQ